MVMRYGDVPADAMPPGAPAVDPSAIMHISYPVGSSILMGSDTPDYMGVPTAGTNFSISVSVDSREEADRVYNGLAAGGNAKFPMGDAFWGSYFGMLTDKYGIEWMISYDPQRQQ
ncbi:unnamed protein product [Rotaria sordida]|uniref:PhnB-like domain-containing protein n=1 Tax=Rotaria sordida TaxID=392033 RepID=A0A813TTP1_9BILA|nr:unnamed protein product [Rotaria sordida]